MSGFLLEVDRLTIVQQQQAVVSDLSFSVRKDAITAIIGASGSGKSLTARALIDLLPDGLSIGSGSVRFSGEAVFSMDKKRRKHYLGKEIGIVFQDTWQTFDPIQTIGRHFLELFAAHSSLSKKAAKEQALHLLRQVQLNDAEKVFRSYPHELSGGMRQRVQLALAISMNPSLLIADEPTTALDLQIQAEMIQLIKDWRQQSGSSVLFISHDLGVVSQIADEVIVMNKGKIAEWSPADKLLTAPRSPEAKQLLADYLLLSGSSKTINRSSSKLIMKVEHVTKQYIKKNWFQQEVIPAVTDVSLHIAQGEIVGLIGESGGGKSTLSRLMLQLEPCTSGKIRWLGNEPFRQGIQWVHQDPLASFDQRWTIEKIVGEGLDYRKEEKETKKERVHTALQQVGLSASDGRLYPHQLSGGMRQRAALARALLMEPELIILDEPFASLDMSSQAKLISLIQSINEEENLAVLFITHDIQVALAICQRIYVMEKGAIAEEADSNKILLTTHPYTKRLLSCMPGFEARRKLLNNKVKVEINE
ncbi:ATP-binding cassette domain-containing protein [Planococcus shenhongbingii]|uniref:ABC transporter ATP-binding protein n=1 Tax=Planococcus shenhongbingii TaxID=3058398 RepID=A0ABT8NBJ1_9BACL|nr:ABC transporter ATP-binding protein [Planococcus sp. N017]MDN7245262.1 ABC transporter ATP-binding protein [Planococcus sp. N017]